MQRATPPLHTPNPHVIQNAKCYVERLKNPALEDPKQSMTKMPHEDILTCFLPSPLPKLLIAS